MFFLTIESTTIFFLKRNRQIYSIFKTPRKTIQLLLHKVLIPPSDFFSADQSDGGFANTLMWSEKMKLKTYRFAAVAAVLLALLVFVAPVSADTVAKIGDTSYADLQTAINESANGAEIVLVANFDLTAQNAQELFMPAYNRESYCGIYIPDDKKLTIDLAGYSVSYYDEHGDVDNVMILNLGDLTINDSVGGGKLSYTPVAGTSKYAKFYSTIFNCGNLTVNGGTIENLAAAETDVTNAVDCHSRLSHEYGNDCILTVNDGTLTGAYYYAVRQYTHYFEGVKNRVIINGGTIEGGIYMQHGDSWYYADASKNRLNVDGYLTINGGNFVPTDTPDQFNTIKSRLSNPDNNKWGLEITGGNFEGTTIQLLVQRGVYYTNGVSGATTPAEAAGTRNTEWLENNGGFITGGTFTSIGDEDDVTTNLKSFLAENYALSENADGTYSVGIDPEIAEVKVGNICYLTLTDAIAAAKAGDTVTLLKDVELTESIKITEGMTVTIEGSGKTMFTSGNNVFYIDGGKLTLGEGLNVHSSTGPAIYILNGEVITSANVKTDAEKGAIQGNGGYEGIVTVNGGTIESNTDCGIYHPQNAPLTINGGTIKGKTAVYFKSGSLSITDGTFIGNGDKVAYDYWDNGCIPTGDALVIENVGNTGYEAITSVSITGGTFTSANAAAVASYAATEANTDAKPVTAFITGGTFSSNPSAYIASGYEVVQPGDKYLVQKYVDRSSSSSSSKPVEEPEEPEQPEEPVVEPETPAAPGEATVETEVTDGGEVEFEAPVEEPGVEGGSAAADEDEAKITGVVLPTGTDSGVTFVPVSEQPAPAGQEENTKKVFEINVPSYEKGKAAVIKFTMTVAELAADGKEAADVALWHFDEETGEWTKLVTSYTIVDGVVYFEAITEDFSPFAIVYEDEPVDEPVEEPETPESPAPVLGLLAALGAAVVLRRK